MAVNSESQINLKTLQRVDSNITKILDNACQVAIYRYERKLEKWEGTDIEGTLFLYERSLHPYYGFIIINRMSTTNFVEAITNDMQFQLQAPYLLYKNHSDDIIGSWFYEKNDLQRIYKKIQTIMLKQTSISKRQRCASESETVPQEDIITLLSEAQEEYTKSVLRKNVEDKNQNSKNNFEEKNNLNTYVEKISPEKSLSSFGKNCQSHGAAATFEGNYPVSPRRRLLSTGSFDPDKLRRLSYASSNVQLKTISSAEEKKDNLANESYQISNYDKILQNKPLTLYGNLSTKLIQPSNQERTSSFTSNLVPDDSYLLHSKPYSINNIENMASSLESFNYQNCRPISIGDMDKHSTNIKETLKSHIKENPKVVLKIHEAYVSSLKSLFIKKS